MKVTITSLDTQKAITLDTTNPSHQRVLDRTLLEINGGGMSARGTANAMYDAECVRTGAMPFTRNGYRVEVGA